MIYKARMLQMCKMFDALDLIEPNFHGHQMPFQMLQEFCIALHELVFQRHLLKII